MKINWTVLFLLLCIVLALTGCESMGVKLTTPEGVKTNFVYTRFILDQKIGSVTYRKPDGTELEIKDKESSVNTEAIEAVGTATGNVVGAAVHAAVTG